MVIAINKNNKNLRILNKHQNAKHVSLESFFRMYLNAMKSKALFFICPITDSNILALVRCLEKES